MRCHLLLAGLLGLSCTIGCSAAEPPGTASNQDDIIGGSDAVEHALDAVTRLETPSGSFCTGTLVAPRLVLTAAHCVEGFDSQGHERPMVAHFMSYDARGSEVAEHEYAAAAILRFGAEKRPDGSLPIGIDIALVMLRDAVPTNVATPIPVRTTPLSEADVGTTMVQVGYGQTRADVAPTWDQTRQKGSVKLNAVAGHPFQKMFASRTAFDAFLLELESAAFVKERGDDLWAQELSAYGQEVHVGGDRTSTQGCYGDSGGALLVRAGERYEIVGVDSNGPEGWKNPCILGERFARAGQQVIDAVRARADRSDPWALVACDEHAKTAACTTTSELTTCRTSIGDGPSTMHQRVERCDARGTVCNASGVSADCK